MARRHRAGMPRAMSDDAHRIRRLRWRVALESRDDADAVRLRLARSVTSALAPALERTFNGLASSDDVIHIPRLEASVRVESTDPLEAATVDAVVDAVRRALEARL